MFWPKFVHSTLALRHVQYVLVEKADHARLAFTFLSLALADAFAGGQQQQSSGVMIYPPRKPGGAISHWRTANGFNVTGGETCTESGHESFLTRVTALSQLALSLGLFPEVRIS
jgi:hypothetical protein